MLYNVRYEIASSEIMSNNLSHLEEEILREFMLLDKEQVGEISLRDCEVALSKCKKLSITPFQIHTLLGLSDCDGDGFVKIVPFAKLCKTFIEESFLFETLAAKSKVAEQLKSSSAAKHPASAELDSIELFRVFQKYDRNRNGVLEMKEYMRCLSETKSLSLSPQEITTLAISADLDDNGVIDFEEFMKHFTDILDMIEFERAIHEKYLDHIAGLMTPT